MERNQPFYLFAALPERDPNEFEQLIDWIKSTASSPRNTRLQNLGNGVVFCRLMAKIFPGSLASVLIINRPANDGDAMHNYMLLEAAFGKVNISWNFDSRKLIASDSAELLKLAKTLAHFRHNYNNQLQHQQKKSTPRSNTNRSSRFPGGELEMSPHLSESQQPSVVSIDEQLSAMQQQLEQISMNQEQQPQSTADHVESQLKQQIQTLFNNQQVAVAAFMAEQQPIATGSGTATANASAPATFTSSVTGTAPCSSVAMETDTVMCLCSNCVNRREYMGSEQNN